jgi:hypothetical protein
MTDFVYKFAAAATGGLFDVPNLTVYDFEPNSPLLIASIELNPPAATTAWSISIVDTDANEVVIASGTTDDPYYVGLQQAHILLWGQKIKVVTSGGAGGAAIAVIKLHRYGSLAWGKTHW